MILSVLSLFGGDDDYGGYGGYGGHNYGGAAASGMMGGGGWQIIAGLVIGLIATILLYVLVFPESKKHTLNGFFTFIRDFFGMKYLIIEKIMKFFYVLNTMVVVFVGFFLLFGSTFLLGLLIMVFGPIVHRLIYESMMLIILLVKNTIEINNKLEDKGGNGENQFEGGFPSFKKKQSAYAAPQMAYAQQTYQQAAQQTYVQPETQQTYVQPETQQTYVQPEAPAQASPAVCPNCGTPIEDGAVFCAGCGTKVG